MLLIVFAVYGLSMVKLPNPDTRLSCCKCILLGMKLSVLEGAGMMSGFLLGVLGSLGGVCTSMASVPSPVGVMAFTVFPLCNRRGGAAKGCRQVYYRCLQVIRLTHRVVHTGDPLVLMWSCVVSEEVFQ